MTSLQKLTDRINFLISLADRTLDTAKYPEGIGVAKVERELFNELRTSSLSFIKNLYGDTHPYYTEFDKYIIRAEPSETKKSRGILRAIKTEIEEGWLDSFKGLVSGEIFTDFLEMAEHLISESYKDPAAVVIGSVLEEHLRQLSKKVGIDTTDIRNSRTVYKKADAMNSDLASKNVYNKLDQKTITAWLDLRNKAAHGKYSEYNLEQVKLMLQGVTEFIARNNI
jgi:hypothetical protein